MFTTLARFLPFVMVVDAIRRDDPCWFVLDRPALCGRPCRLVGWVERLDEQLGEGDVEGGPEDRQGAEEGQLPPRPPEPSRTHGQRRSGPAEIEVEDIAVRR